MTHGNAVTSRCIVAGLTLAGLAACATAPVSHQRAESAVSESRVRFEMGVLAHDSMQGRMTGTRGAASAAAFIASQMQDIGLVPQGDSGYFQRIPIALTPRTYGADRLSLVSDFTVLDSFPDSRRRPGVNVIGMLRGTDPTVGSEVVLIDAHYDHLGIGAPVNGDSIYNGADDNASGTTAVLEIARSLANGPPPRRSILFVATTGDEAGLIGTRWFIAHPPVNLKAIVAILGIQMIGRPDPAAGGSGRAWLTGYDRSSMGPAFATAGLHIVRDPRPDEHFFERSDNIVFARLGIPAQTLSTYNLHTDYHRPSDDLSKIDFGHMTRVIQTAASAVRLLADGPVPRWTKSGKPTD